MNSYPSAPNAIKAGAPVPSGLSVMPILIFRNDAGVAAVWHADKDGLGNATTENLLRRFYLDVS